MKVLFSNSHKLIIFTFIFLFSLYLISESSHPFLSCQNDQTLSIKDSIVPWRAPEVSSIPDNEDGKIIILGRNIFNKTNLYLGPDVSNEANRYTNAGLACQNCHLKGGTLKNVMGLVGVYYNYPKFDTRSGKNINIEERINNCMKRSLNGKPLPDTSKEMTALVSYMKWLSTYAPKGTKVEGQGLPKIELINRAADKENGKNVYLNYCTTCHADNGQGVLRSPGNVDVLADSLKGYEFPPVMGSNSFNDGAGMYRLLTATSFIYAKMPYNDAILSLEDSYDVAAYIISTPRPKLPGIESDYPDLKFKPVDFPFPPYQDKFSAEEHKYGPYQPMLKEGETSKFVKPL